ncbi:hypothetical protein EMCRGX_G017693 [Ephydatia muelleri]
MWFPFSSDGDLGVMEGREGSSMMRLLCYNACFGCIDVVAICWTKEDKLVPPGAKVGNLASGFGIICIPDFINVMIYIVDERKDGKGIHGHGERIALSSCGTIKCALQMCYVMSQVTCHEQGIPIKHHMYRSEEWHGADLKNVMGYSRIVQG